MMSEKVRKAIETRVVRVRLITAESYQMLIGLGYQVVFVFDKKKTLNN